MKVLVVDDIPENLELIYNILKDEPYQLLTASDGPRALEIAREVLPNLILMDAMMPDMDGFETTRRLKDSDVTKEIPVIFVTALKDLDNKLNAFSLGAVDYVTKPLQAEEIRARITNHLNLAKLRRELAVRNDALRMKNAALEEMIRQKEEILRIAAHDLKNPASAVLNMLELYPDLDPELATALKSSVGVQIEIINNLMKAERLERGEQELERVPTDLVLNLGLHISVVSPAAKLKNQEIVVSAPESLVYSCDPVLMGEVFENYLSNAVKYSPKGGRIDVRLFTLRGEVHLEVSDEGPGLKEEDFNAVFGKFSRLSAVPTGGETSTGLGLSIVKTVVAMHGGDVGVVNNPRHGATFLAAFPLSDEIEPEAI